MAGEAEQPTVIKDPSQYAMLPAGTKVLWGVAGTVLADAKLLQSAMGIGASGKKGAFLKVTRLIDTDPKYMSDMGEGEDKTFTFLDDPDDADQEDFLKAAESKSTVALFIVYPNKRVATFSLVLAGWSVQAVDSPDGKVMQVEVYARQNSVKWSRAA
ncbi:phage tail protein [Pectobacterium aroidearum]|uniref:Phage tail protein n=1 Tax=Pectobacterium aroidearum TaxID=1201031 RepID=A0ABR5ZJK4_9GAMM|nr:phage tail protein [Pectobacterium aroidearum]MBA5234754.1 phage tail protein [Pectobacterium aroidearum]MBA5739933.1 phage tail protein [Pectobacterium aroidearum]